MTFSGKWIQKMADGTVKQINPFTGTEVWTVPGRGFKPLTNKIPENAKKIEPKVPEDYCNFCPSRYLNTPPEKARLIVEDGKWLMQKHLSAEMVKAGIAEFRRIPNLFEIVSYDYWNRNYGYVPDPSSTAWKEKYLSSPGGLDHVLSILNLKLKLSGKREKEIAETPLEEKLAMANAFFAGGHELIVARRHYIDGAEYDVELCSSGELTPEEHFHYMKFTIEAMRGIYSTNRYVRYISVFQNWLGPAGASFDHLHKQLVAIDEWGTSIEQEVDAVRKNPNIYNEFATNYAGYQNLVFAENEHAIAFADWGHRFPTLAVYSKSDKPSPMMMTDAEIRGMSDIVHACHAAMSSSIPCNEEWYYTPPDCTEAMPWHILIKWRINTPAGFEGGTKIYINTIDPESLRDKVVPRIFELKNKGKIAVFDIAFECACEPNCLLYNSATRMAPSYKMSMGSCYEQKK
ncbi:MAG: DUF4921 family protein [Planctomycetota bacterium]